jgi:hypothetical protein
MALRHVLDTQRAMNLLYYLPLSTHISFYRDRSCVYLHSYHSPFYYYSRTNLDPTD